MKYKITIDVEITDNFCTCEDCFGDRPEDILADLVEEFEVNTKSDLQDLDPRIVTCLEEVPPRVLQ